MVFRNLPERTRPSTQEIRGPQITAPNKALEGFLRSTKTKPSDLQQAIIRGKTFWFAVRKIPGKPLVQLLPEILPKAIRAVHWPRSMHWLPDSHFRWIRPLRGILCLLDEETIPLDLEGIPTGRETRGHAFLNPEKISIRNPDSYLKQLLDAHVISLAQVREETIAQQAQVQADELGLEVVPDEELVEEMAGLTEWPVVFADPDRSGIHRSTR